jgi:hypothetical protein
VRPYWEGAREDPRRAPLSRLPEHLRRSRQHRRLRAPRAPARSRARVARVGLGDTLDPARTISCTSAAARIASRRSIAPDLAAKADALRRARARRRAAGRVRRLPAPRAGLPRARRLVHAGAGSSRTRPSPATSA